MITLQLIGFIFPSGFTPDLRLLSSGFWLLTLFSKILSPVSSILMFKVPAARKNHGQTIAIA